MERAAPERKQVVMQKAVKRMQERGLPGAALTLFALCLSLLLSNTRGAQCTRYDGSLPCSFGGCEFSKDANGVLDRTGSCPAQTGWLWLEASSATWAPASESCVLSAYTLSFPSLHVSPSLFLTRVPPSSVVNTGPFKNFFPCNHFINI